jgi:uncharacterized membrane protein
MIGIGVRVRITNHGHAALTDVAETVANAHKMLS